VGYKNIYTPKKKIKGQTQTTVWLPPPPPQGGIRGVPPPPPHPTPTHPTRFESHNCA